MMSGHNYDNYIVEDFLADESFQQYCGQTTAEAVEKWTRILNQYPHLRVRAEEAEKFFHLLSGHQGKIEEEKRKLLSRIEVHKTPVRRMRITWWAAAVFFVVISAGAWLALNQNAKQEFQAVVVADEVLPGSSKAYLTLGDGRRVLLDSTHSGEITTDGGVILTQLNGTLAYNAKDGDKAVEFNTITTPPGGQFQVILADGSHVWLNAGSSLRYPTVFTGTRREVEITGEAYFEVAHKNDQPFIVRAEDMKITVLGTGFNVSAYADEEHIKTTLVNGSVKVSAKITSLIIEPGEQALSTKSGDLIVNKDVNVEVIIAWKNGKFIFAGENIQEVMKQLERWYDVEIEFAPGVPQEEFIGMISRYASLSEVLKMLEKTETVRFTRQGKKITVLPFKDR